MINKIKCGVVGATGYTGGELLRLLVHHPHAAITMIYSRSQAGKPVTSVHPDLVELFDQTFTSSLNQDLDVIFLCTPHGKAREFLQGVQNKHTKIIDLSTDHRDESDGFVYGLCELQRQQIAAASKVANPGCFATAIQLALIPAAQSRLLPEDVHITAITGTTGAGAKLSDTSHFSWRAHNIGVYKLFTHQHLEEINRTISTICATLPAINFVPMRGPFTRGILASIYWKSDASESKVKEIYKDAYKAHPFTEVCPHDIDLKQVVGTNRCLLQIQKIGPHVHVTSAIDNLLKGASGQAVQNMNLMFGFPESTALNLKAMVY